jgi:hypothetical protein
MVLMLGCANNAYADGGLSPFEPLPGFAPSSIVFDELGGHYDKWIMALPCTANRANVTVKFYKSNFSSKWAPVREIQFNPLKMGEKPRAYLM